MITFTEGQLLAWLTPLLWPFLRTLALFSAMPVLGTRSVPVRVRIGLAGFIGWLLVGLAGTLRHGLGAMLVPRPGPGLFVALAGAALIILGSLRGRLGLDAPRLLSTATANPGASRQVLRVHRWCRARAPAHPPARSTTHDGFTGRRSSRYSAQQSDK